MNAQAISGSEFGVGVLGSILTGVGDSKAGKGQEAAYDYNADISLENMRSDVEANQQKFSGLVGTQAGRYAAAGVDIASGSPLLIMAATAARGARESEQIEEAGNGRSELATLLREDRSVPGNHERDWRFFIWIHKGVHILLRRHSQDTCTNGKLICQRFPESRTCNLLQSHTRNRANSGSLGRLLLNWEKPLRTLRTWDLRCKLTFGKRRSTLIL